MHGGAVTLANRFLSRIGAKFDLTLATDMLDLTTFLALVRREAAGIPAALYFHENQLVYPWSPADRDVGKGRDRHYGFINYASALSADAVLFNSAYHMNSFCGALPGFLRHFPDHREIETADTIRAKSRVLYLGLDLARFDRGSPAERGEPEQPPLVLWNHRWEYDKNPAEFVRLLLQLAGEEIPFRIALLGRNFRQQPAEFERLRETLGDRIVHYGEVKSETEYSAWLRRADVLPVTSHQDFFGASVMEAMYNGCLPLLPDRLAYPELIPSDLHGRLLYSDYSGLVAMLRRCLLNIGEARQYDLRAIAARFSWENMAPVYDEVLAELARYGRV